MIHPLDTMRAAYAAEYHLQVAISEVRLPEVQTHDEALVIGEVVRIFRGSREMLGRELRLTVPVCGVDGEAVPGPPMYRRERLASAKVLEAFVDPTADGHEIALYNDATLDAPTDAPTLPVPTRAQLDALVREHPEPPRFDLTLFLILGGLFSGTAAIVGYVGWVIWKAVR